MTIVNYDTPSCELIGLSARPRIRRAPLFNYIHNMMIIKEISYLSSFLADNNNLLSTSLVLSRRHVASVDSAKQCANVLQMTRLRRKYVVVLG